MKSIISAENEDKKMYEEYGIAEWREKCLVLTPAEKILIKEDLANRRNTPLVVIAKLPFPHFAELYFSGYPESASYLSDPAFGYKLYMMSESNIRMLSEMIRHPEKTQTELQEQFGTRVDREEIYEFMRINMIEIPKIVGASKLQTIREIKYAYLTQYIDLKEARRLELPIAERCELDMQNTDAIVDGFEFDRKLSTLNSVARYIVVKALGLYGNKRTGFKEISKDLGMSDGRVKDLFDYLFPSLTLTYGDFVNKTGYIEKDYKPGEYKIHSNGAYKKLDLDVQTRFLFARGISEAERIVLSGYSIRDRLIYLAYKYLIQDKDFANSYLDLTKKEKDFLEPEGGKGSL